MENFAYSRLDQAGRQIRLLRCDKDFNFELDIYNVDTCPPYLALSYTWGSSERPHCISLNEQKPYSWKLDPVSPDRKVDPLRFKPGDTKTRIYNGSGGWHFWIDAICIDQNSPVERNHQVQLMTDIYRGAEIVIVSLGSECDDIFYSFALGREPSFSSLWKAEYWKRLWTAQEFVLARDIVFISVFCAISIKSISKLLVGKSYPEWRLPALEIRRKSVEGKLVLGGIRQGATLRNVIWLFRRQKCSEIRDTIYAVLALVNWDLEAVQSGQGPLEADYRITLRELWEKLQRYGITWGELSPDFQSAVDMESERLPITFDNTSHPPQIVPDIDDIHTTERAPWDNNTSAVPLTQLQKELSTNTKNAASPCRLSWKPFFCGALITSTASWARAYSKQGQWKDVKELEVRMVEKVTRVLGETHPSTLTSLANLASMYKDQEQWEQGEILCVRIVEIVIGVLGLEHPDTLTSMFNLAIIYWNQGRWKEAEELFARVMETRKRVLGEEHPDTLGSMAWLASTYSNQGRWKEAEELNVRVVEMRKRVLGEEHPDTLSSMANLASTFWNQGRWKEAEELFVRVIETRKRVLGEEHPSTLTSMNNLAFTWKGQGRNKEAVNLMNECVGLRTQVLGADHPFTLSSTKALNNWKFNGLDIN